MDISREEWEKIQTENRVLQQKVATLQALRDVARTLSLELNLRPLLDMIMGSAADLLQATASSLLLMDRETGELVFDVVSGGGGTLLEQRRMSASAGIPGWVITHQQPLIVNDAGHDPRVRRDIAESVAFPLKAIIAVPMIARGRIIGVLEVLNKRSGQDFTQDDLDLLCALAAQAAVAIENARLYQDLRQERDRLIDTEEMVRKKLQRELHDGLAQTLAAMAMKANVISRQLARDPGKAAKELDSLETDLYASVHGVRDLLFDLRPLILETQGLAPALETYMARVRPEGGAQIHLDTEGFAGRLDHRTEIIVFGVIQEAVNNSVKHAQASHVWIKLAGRPGRFQVTIRDDGRGFDLRQVQKGYEQRGSFGLLNMQERASHIGGELRLDSQPGQGTTVTLTVKRQA